MIIHTADKLYCITSGSPDKFPTPCWINSHLRHQPIILYVFSFNF